MTTRISSDGPQPNVAVAPTAHRLTPTPSRPFESLVDSGASAVVQGAEAAASRLPGGPSLVAAVRGGGSAPFALSSGAGVDTSPTGSGFGAGQPGLGQSGSGQPVSDIETAISQQTEDSMYFLGLQQRIQNETRSFQAMSNVLKARHDSVKNAIGNLR